MGRISKLCRYMIDVTGLDPLFFGELVGGGGPVLWQFGASG